MEKFPPAQKAPASQQGFTLVELMIVLAIMAILLSLAVPSFNRVIRENRVLAASNSLVAAVAQARSEAVKRGRMVSLCPSSDQATCSGTWSDGWLIYLEKSTVMAGGAPDMETALLTGDGVANMNIIRTTGANNWVRFSGRGIAEESITLEVRPSECGVQANVDYQQLVIGVSGRSTMNKLACP